MYLYASAVLRFIVKSPPSIRWNPLSRRSASSTASNMSLTAVSGVRILTCSASMRFTMFDRDVFAA